MNEQPTLTLNNGVKIPQLGLGTWQLKDGPECYNAVRFALETGYRHIDTAKIYGNEASVGKAIRDSGIDRREIFVTTKLWNDDHMRVQEAFKQSLQLLDIGYIDLYLIHWPVAQRVMSYKSLQTLVQTDLLHSIGVSNFIVQHIDDLLRRTSVVPVVNQVEFNPFLYQAELLEHCKSRNIRLVAYSPLARGKRNSHPTLIRLAANYSKTVPQVLLRWGIQHGVIVIPKSAQPDHIRENSQIFDWEIEEHDMLLLDNLNENLRLGWDPTSMK